jgi:protein-disulfide isomerase
MPQGRYLAGHRALMDFRGDLTSAQIDRLARNAGIDVARMRRGMDEPAITTHLQENLALASDLNISGTPGFLINGELISGFNREQLQERLAEATRETRARRQASR